MKTNSSDIADLPLSELSLMIRSRDLRATDLVEIYLDRIERFDGPDGINAYITVMGESALKRTAELDDMAKAGKFAGPLHGLPIAVKDNILTAGVRTTCGSKILANWRPPIDAHVIKRLKQAGAVILGKTNMHELGWGVTNNNPHYGPTRNPYDFTRIPGGSSGGSAAAVAAALCAGALGGDAGGSIRIPAAMCGVVGLKPTRGRVGRTGSAYFSFTRDCIGPMTRTVKDAAVLLEALAGYDPEDPDTIQDPIPSYSALRNTELRGKSFGLLREYFCELIHPETERVLNESITLIRQLGGRVEEANIKHVELFEPTTLNIIRPEFVYHLENQLKAFDPEASIEGYLDQMSPDVRRNIAVEKGRPDSTPVPAYVYLKAVRDDLKRITAAFDEVISGFDALILPTTPLPAPEINESQTAELNGRSYSAELLLIRNNDQMNTAGYPAITVPAGYSSKGMPVGLQIVARPWEEEKLLTMAFGFEQATQVRYPPSLHE